MEVIYQYECHFTKRSLLSTFVFQHTKSTQYAPIIDTLPSIIASVQRLRCKNFCINRSCNKGSKGQEREKKYGNKLDILLTSYRSYYQHPKISLADLKTIFNARFKAEKMIKYLGIWDDNYFYFNQIQVFVTHDIINLF